MNGDLSRTIHLLKSVDNVHVILMEESQRQIRKKGGVEA